MSERREDHRQEAGKLWDKTFEDNQDLDDSGHLSRTAHRKQSSHNSRITTILIVLIVILAATPIIYWVHHEQSFNHPQQTEKVAQSVSSKAKKHPATRSLKPSPSQALLRLPKPRRLKPKAAVKRIQPVLPVPRAAHLQVRLPVPHQPVRVGQSIRRLAQGRASIAWQPIMG